MLPRSPPTLGLWRSVKILGDSIRLPASFNNVVGLRPTVGLVSTAGASSFRIGTDTIGPIARTVEDVARLLDVLARPDTRDPLTALAEGPRRSRRTSYLEAARGEGSAAELRPVKLGLVTSLMPHTGPDAAPVGRVVDTAVAALGAAEVYVIGLDLPDLLDRVRKSRLTVPGSRCARMSPGLSALASSMPLSTRTSKRSLRGMTRSSAERLTAPSSRPTQSSHLPSASRLSPCRRGSRAMACR